MGAHLTMKNKKVLPEKVRKDVIKRCGPQCFYCGKEGFATSRFGKSVVLEKEPYKKWINEYDGTFIFEHKAMHFDHVIPIMKGGPDTVDNVVIACERCNKSKGTRKGPVNLNRFR